MWRLRKSMRGRFSRASFWPSCVAAAGETFRKRLPKRQRPRNCLGGDRQNGGDRENGWEATAKTAVAGEILGKRLPKRR